MNKNLIATALIAFASLAGLPAYAAGDHAGHGTAQAGAAEMQMVDGQVKKVDKAAGKVTLPWPAGQSEHAGHDHGFQSQ